jgi:hypothetical protein
LGEVTQLITALSGLITALAWPAIVVFVLFRYRKELAAGVGGLAKRLPQAKSFELGPLKLALSESVSAAVQVPADPGPVDQQKAIQQQRRIGEALKAEADTAMLPQIKTHLDDLARQYELMRAARDVQKRKANDAEIIEMNKLVGQMRALAISCAGFWADYASSSRPGDRLAAVVIAQMSPDPKYLDWLQGRFAVDRPFIFYHAALALQNMADQCWTEAREQIKSTAQNAVEQVKAFSGEPDAKTLQVLEAILART